MAAVDDAFTVFLHRIELNPTRVELASKRYQAVKAAIESELEDATVRQIGSFQRKTKIRPRDLSDRLDVDALVVLGTFTQKASRGDGVTPKKAFERVLRVLRRDPTYRVMQPEADAPVVVLEYADSFAMEVAVGYVDQTGDLPRAETAGRPCYVVASHGNWVPADYDYDADYISSHNQLPHINGVLVPTIKMLKFLLRICEVPLKSIHTEILAALTVPAIIEGWQNKAVPFGYPNLIAEFLRGAKNHLGTPVCLPGSYSPAIDSGQPKKELARVAKFLDTLGDKAWSICKVKHQERAITKWGDFFGEPFPAPSAVS